MANEPTVPQWLCTCCYVLLVNGDACMYCCDLKDLLSQFEGMHVTSGMLFKEHSCGRERGEKVEECDCEEISFSWSACDGCGANYGGARYAATGWIQVNA